LHVQAEITSELNLWRAELVSCQWTRSAIEVVLYNCTKTFCCTHCQCSSIIRKYSTFYIESSMFVVSHEFIVWLAKWTIRESSKQQ